MSRQADITLDVRRLLDMHYSADLVNQSYFFLLMTRGSNLSFLHLSLKQIRAETWRKEHRSRDGPLNRPSSNNNPHEDTYHCQDLEKENSCEYC